MINIVLDLIYGACLLLVEWSLLVILIFNSATTRYTQANMLAAVTIEKPELNRVHSVYMLSCAIFVTAGSNHKHLRCAKRQHGQCIPVHHLAAAGPMKGH